MLAAGSQAGKTVNNPVMIASRDGTVHLLYCVMYGVESSNGGVFYRRSDDDGVSWSEPEEISDMTSPEIRNVIATGPGHGHRAARRARCSCPSGWCSRSRARRTCPTIRRW